MIRLISDYKTLFYLHFCVNKISTVKPADEVASIYEAVTFILSNH